MKVTKAAGVELSGAPSEEQLEKINRLTKTKVTAEDVYVFSVRLCDDQVDRDDERFSEACIRELAALFVGKTGIMDHAWSAEKQVARIFDTEVLTQNGVTMLKGWAYMLRGAETDGLIRQIEGGIKKEVSIGCAVRRKMCSICGEEYGACGHVKGETYGTERCAAVLCEAVDAYEFSFVAVPAQPRAGVLKRCGGEDAGTLKTLVKRRGSRANQRDVDSLEEQAEVGKRDLSELRGEVKRLMLVCEQEADGEAIEKLAEKLDESELKEMEKLYRGKMAKKLGLRTQLTYGEKTKAAEDESDFRV